MNWKLPKELRWRADLLEELSNIPIDLEHMLDLMLDAADQMREAATEIERLRDLWTNRQWPIEIEEGDRANG